MTVPVLPTREPAWSTASHHRPPATDPATALVVGGTLSMQSASPGKDGAGIARRLLVRGIAVTLFSQPSMIEMRGNDVRRLADTSMEAETKNLISDAQCWIGRAGKLLKQYARNRHNSKHNRKTDAHAHTSIIPITLCPISIRNPHAARPEITQKSGCKKCGGRMLN